MPISQYRQYRPALTIFLLIIICSVLLAGCAPGFGPDGWAGPTVSDNTLYVISQGDGEFLAIDLSNPHSPPSNLTPRLEEESSNFLGCEGPSEKLVGYGTPIVSDGIAYIGAYDGKVYAVNTETEVEKWLPVETDGPIIANPVIQGTRLIIASNNELYAIDTQDGSFAWNEPFKADGKIWSNPVIYEGRIYFGSLGHKLYSVDLASGEGKILRDFDGPVASTPLIVDGTIYIGTFESKFYAIDAETGDLKWDEPFKAGDWFWSTAAYSDGTVYVGSIDHNVYAIDAVTGKAKWSRPILTEGPIRAAAVIVDDVLLVACKADNGFVYGLDLETGNDKWRPVSVGKIYADPWVEGATVYYLNEDDELYALSAEDGSIGIDWPISLRRK